MRLFGWLLRSRTFATGNGSRVHSHFEKRQIRFSAHSDKRYAHSRFGRLQGQTGTLHVRHKVVEAAKPHHYGQLVQRIHRLGLRIQKALNM
ncbi:hypothetical protein TTRE_0000650501 [Trichuris trichiura]|uniref:Uncharacterized protein n=1 Tax=Trichuris trichiura TaxID=36087 RepID=A0A077ZHX5_TRITR|nr:hypothetical protein TTRE_0000650501 [Trichuris trichiura]